MLRLELLAPAKDKAVGIAAIDCGADAVYIAGPAWGNRNAAGNSIEDIRELCAYAHRFGVKIYLTVNTLIYPDEWPAVHSMMLQAQDAGVDASCAGLQWRRSHGCDGGEKGLSLLGADSLL